AGEVRAAVAVGDHVGVGHDRLPEAGGVDHADLDLDLLGTTVGVDGGGALGDDGLVVERLGVLGEGLGVRPYPTLLVEHLADGGVFAPVLDDDLDAAREEGQLTQPPAHASVVEPVDLLEDGVVGQEGDRRPVAALGRGALDVQRGHDVTVLERDVVEVAVALDLGLEAHGQGVDHRTADPVQAAGDLVGAFAELAAGVKLGEDDLDGGPALCFHDVDGDTAPVVGHRRRTIGVEHHLDGVGLAGQGLVDGVVDDLGQQLMVAVGPGAALYVHGGPFAYSV